MDQDNSVTYKVTFNNKSFEPITISDDTGGDAPLFPSYTIPPNQAATLEYSCEDCPMFAFNYEVQSTSGISYVLCLCDGTEYLPNGGLADYTFGYCPSSDFTNDQEKASGKCSRCRPSDPCQSFGG